MKRLWVNADPYNKEIVIAVLESRAEAVFFLTFLQKYVKIPASLQVGRRQTAP